MLKAIFRFSVISIFVIFLIKCDEYEFPESPYPAIETLPVVNISKTGVTFQAAITRPGEKEITDHGFVWGLTENLSIESEDKIQLGPKTGIGSFEADAKSGLYEGETYYVKAFVATEDYFVYGETVSFTSIGSTPPVINSFSPLEGTWGDTITIKGKYFSLINKDNTVRFGSFDSKVLTSSDSIIKCIVPNDIPFKTVPIYLTVAGNKIQSNVDFVLITPSITSFSPMIATFGDVITITGTNFSSIKEKNVVTFNNHIAEITESSGTQLKVKIPSTIKEKESTVNVMVNLQSTSANITFNILPPSISSLSTSNEFIGATIQIIGNNFNPTPEGNNVFFGECNAVILNATKSLLTVQIPNGIYNERSFKVEVQVAEQSALSPESFTLQNAWLRKDVMQPMEERSNAVTFVVNGKGYIGLGSKFGFLYKNFWEYDPVTRVWVSIGDFPDKVRDAAVSFVIGNYAYVGGGYDPYTSEPLFDFWRFEPQFRTWTRVSDLPVAMIWNSISFSASQKGYVVIGGESDNFWEYNANGDKWTKKSDFSGGPIRSGGFTLGNNIFVHSSDASTSPNRLDEYSVIADSWFAKADVEDTSFETIALGFSVNGYGYLMGTGRVNKYNPVSDSWTKLPETGPFQVGAFSFVINDKAYLWNSTTLWEFDPDFE